MRRISGPIDDDDLQGAELSEASSISTPGSTDALFALLKQRDEALRYFEDHPDSYGAMASWETADDALRTAITRLSDSLARDLEGLRADRAALATALMKTWAGGAWPNETYFLARDITAALSKSPPTEKDG